MLLDEVAAATGLSGRRRHAGASPERARVAVQKTLSAAMTAPSTSIRSRPTAV
jgi:hypothetical protein